MPIYDFRCLDCEAKAEMVLKVDDPRTGLRCERCGGELGRIIVPGHGGFQSTTPVWLDDEVKGCLQDTDAVAAGLEKPIEDRTDYQRHLRDHDIVERC